MKGKVSFTQQWYHSEVRITEAISANNRANLVFCPDPKLLGIQFREYHMIPLFKTKFQKPIESKTSSAHAVTRLLKIMREIYSPSCAARVTNEEGK